MNGTFVDRTRELAALEQFWTSGKAECLPVVGRRRVGKTYLLERFAAGKRHVYYRCQLKSSDEQVAMLGASLAELADDPVLTAQPPASWPALFATIERLAASERLLLILDEIPYWVARDESIPSILQNWWDSRGRSLNLMLVFCGSAVQMMEKLLTGDAPLAGCLTGRMSVRPLDFRSATDLLQFTDPIDNLTAYGILGGIPLYLTFFRRDRSIRDNILASIASSSSRLYVEPQTVFAAHHEVFAADQALAVLRALARGKHKWSDILQASSVTATQLGRTMDLLTGDMALVERVLPVTESHASRAYFTQYHLADQFFRFWFRFIEPNQGALEFGNEATIVDAIMERLSEHLGSSFETICRDWVRLANAAGALPVRLTSVGSWWSANHEIDVVGVDEDNRVVLTGECKWQSQPLGWDDLEKYLSHVRELGPLLHPNAIHLLFSKTGFHDSVRQWASDNGARLMTPELLLQPFASTWAARPTPLPQQPKPA